VPAAPRPTVLATSACSATQASSRRLIRNAKPVHWVRSRHVSVHVSVMAVQPERKPMLHRADASCAMLVSSPPVMRDANDVLSAPSARMQEPRLATTVHAARRLMRPAPSASSVNRVTSRPMMVNANNAQSTRSRPVPELASAIRADLHRSPTATRRIVPSVLPVHSPMTMGCVKCANREQCLLQEPLCASSAHVVPKQMTLVPSVCSATLASSPMPIRNAKPAHWDRSRPDSVHASVTIAQSVHKPMLQ
jgi:hypothetical protein